MKITLKYPETVWLDRWGFLVPWFEWTMIWYFSGSRAFSTLVVLLPAWLTNISTLWFNVVTHGRTGGNDTGCAARKCLIFSGIILGENDHQDHHAHPRKAYRPGPDLPYQLILRPMAFLGAIHNLRAG